jgi:ABC-type transporter Mla MlaB component
MLRIIRIGGGDSVITLKLEGTLRLAWIGEVRNAVAQTRAQASRTCLDLSALSFVDAAGLELLRDLIRDGIEIAACSSYVAELLQLDR